MSRRTVPVSFYIPVKDGEDFIGACVESVLAQTTPPAEITVYYNVGSRDRTRDILARYPVTIQDVTVPLSDTRNLATRTLPHEWIGCCDADVVLAPDWLERLWAHNDKQYAVLSGNTTERIRTAGDHFRALTSPHNWGPHDVQNPYMLVPDMLAHKPTLQAVGEYRTGWVNYEDSELSQRLKRQGKQFYYVAAAHAEHWRRDTPFSSLDLRWRHSFHRQASLFATLAGCRQKQRNNIALATVIISLAATERAAEVLPIALLMPLHHLLRDLAQYPSFGAETECLPIGECPSIVQFRSAWQSAWSDEMEQLWRQSATCSAPQTLLATFADCYSRFLHAAARSVPHSVPALHAIPAPPDAHNPWAIDDQIWQDMCKCAQQQAGALFRIAPETDIALHERRPPDMASCPSGLIGFRQRLYPDPLQPWTCRAITMLLAQHRKRLAWTETFQGSTVIAFY